MKWLKSTPVQHSVQCSHRGWRASARTCVFGSKSVRMCVKQWWRGREERRRERGRACIMCVSSFVFKACFPSPSPFLPLSIFSLISLLPSIHPSIPFPYLPSLFPFLLLPFSEWSVSHRGHEPDPNISRKKGGMLQTKMMRREKDVCLYKAAVLRASSSAHSGYGLMIHGYWSSLPRVHVTSQVRTGRERCRWWCVVCLLCTLCLSVWEVSGN